MRYTRYSTSFALGYLVVSFLHMIVDLAVGALQLLGLLLGFAVKGVDFGRRSAFEDALRAALAPYMPVLVSKRSSLLRVDDYGVLKNECWSKELGYFMGEALLPNLGSYEGYARRNLSYVSCLVDDMIAAEQPIPQIDVPSAAEHINDA